MIDSIVRREHLLAAGVSPAKADVYLDPLASATSEFLIDNLRRWAFFLATVAWESEDFKYTAEIWGPTPAQLAYEGRKDLGNTYPGDGQRFKGRGLIELTGRANYVEVSTALYGDPLTLVQHPELLEQPLPACRSAGWFWFRHGLSAVADQNDFDRVTRVVNGGMNGIVGRRQILTSVGAAMGLTL